MWGRHVYLLAYMKSLIDYDICYEQMFPYISDPDPSKVTPVPPHIQLSSDLFCPARRDAIT